MENVRNEQVSGCRKVQLFSFDDKTDCAVPFIFLNGLLTGFYHRSDLDAKKI